MHELCKLGHMTKKCHFPNVGGNLQEVSVGVIGIHQKWKQHTFDIFLINMGLQGLNPLVNLGFQVGTIASIYRVSKVSVITFRARQNSVWVCNRDVFSENTWKFTISPISQILNPLVNLGFQVGTIASIYRVSKVSVITFRVRQNSVWVCNIIIIIIINIQEVGKSCCSRSHLFSILSLNFINHYSWYAYSSLDQCWSKRVLNISSESAAVTIW